MKRRCVVVDSTDSDRPSPFASLLEIHLVASVYDVESLLDGPCGEIGKSLVR
jgi:hypothetical protein